jgi:sugar phosphate isomerase/epimerase
MKLAFMSSVCPKLTLPELLAAGEAHGYEGVEFRPEWDHAHGIEPGSPASGRKEAAEALADSPLEGCCLSPGVRFCRDEPGDRDAQLETLFRYIDLAADVGIPRIRVFGDPLPNAGAGRRAANYHAQAEYLARGAERARAAGVRLVLETHSNFRAFDAGEVLYRAAYPPALRVNWHLGHCLRHGEDVDEAYRHVKGRVDHVHFSLGEEKTDRAHIERQAVLLAAEGFAGFFSVEVINPPDPEQVLEAHAKGWGELKGRLGL